MNGKSSARSGGDAPAGVVDSVLDGNMGAVARTISLIEDRTPLFRDILKKLYSHTNQATVVGITGPPGSGKSTLVDALVSTYPETQRQIGILAVDPSSPYSGGSVLGDRIRFGHRSNQEGVFFRSMSSRGRSGGLATATNDAIRILDAAGYDPILVETVGAGQNEVDIVRTAETVVLVTMPSSGDDIQMLKAGILEIADIFVVNKMDLEGSDRTVMDLKEMVRRRENTETDWEIPVLETEARAGRNVQELNSAIVKHGEFLRERNLLRQKRLNRIEDEVLGLLEEEIRESAMETVNAMGGLDQLCRRLLEEGKDPYSLVEHLMERV